MTPYIIPSFRGGISDENDKGIPGSFKYGYGLDIHSRDDALMCASTMATIDETIIGDLINFFVTAADGSTYAFGNGGSIWAISGNIGDPAVTYVYNDENGRIRGAGEWKISDGNNYLFWATNTSIARVALNGSIDTPWAAGVVTQDYKTTLDAAEWHTMDLSSGLLTIANGNYLASIDTDGAFNPATTNVRPGNLIKALDERDDYTIMGSYRTDRSEEGYLWSWVTNAINYVQKKRIPIQGVNALISSELPLLQGGDDGEIFLADFTNTEPTATIPGGGKADPGGVAIENDLASFGIYGGTYPGIWNYGRRARNRSNALNYQYRLAKTISGSTISTVGALTVMNSQLLVSWGTTDGSTSDYGIDAVSTTTKASALYEGLEFDGGIPHLKKPFNTVKLVMDLMPAGTSVSVKYKQNKETDWRYGVTASNTTTFSETNAVEAIFTLDANAMIFEVGVELTPSGSTTPKILNVITYVGDGREEF